MLSYVLLFSSSVVFLGGSMLGVCLIVFYLLSVLGLFWYGLIFILINVGGVMVLFYYVFTLNPNPQQTVILGMGGLFMLGVSLVLLMGFSQGVGIGSAVDGVYEIVESVEDCSYMLFSLVESQFLILVSLLLVFALLVVSYLTSSIGGSFRPFSA
uniref:NADH dehydrogenase subunit 6 n=1 Tax=Diversibipalium mayottensis TaxID=3348909 RepID=A0A8K1X7B0_9PLAT|nr:NADH dehydrogenase subunit 6 [Diversibipalium sp. MNHN JL281]